MLRERKSTLHPPPDAGPRPLTERLVTWSVRHRARAMAGWLALVAAAVLAGVLVTGDGAPPVDPGEAGTARRVLDAQGGYEPIQENVLVRATDPAGPPAATDPTVRAAVADLVRTLRALPAGGVTVADPLDAPDRVSADRRALLVGFAVDGGLDERLVRYDAATAAVGDVARRHPGVRLAQAGDRSLAQAVDQGVKGDFALAHQLSLPLTVLILLVVFGSLVVAAVPLLLTLTAVAATLGLLQVVDQWLPINSVTAPMVLLIGMAVGVDYCLFNLRRLREERAAGHDLGTALAITARTSGRVVLVSGATVMVCLCGLLLTGISAYRGATLGIVLVVGATVLASVTALPALLALLGDRVDRLRVPWPGRRRTATAPSRFWTAVAVRVVRRPLLWTLAGAALLVTLALPALRMHPQDAAVVDSLPRTVPTVDAAVRMQRDFPGAAAPARVVLWRPDGAAVAGRPEVDAAVTDLRARIAGGVPGLAGPVTVATVDRALVVRVPLAGSGTDRASERALATLRGEVLPATVGRVDGVEHAVMGRTAFAHDFTERMTGRAPLVVGAVLLLAFALLTVTFRTLAVPLVSIALNLLSIGAAYGVLTWAFQDGHLAGPLGFTPYGGVVGWLPLFMFVLLFGLSMDYHLFVLSRIRERWAAGAAPGPAIVAGVGRGAGVVSSAATVMVAVFAVFLTLSAIEYKMLGLGMAVAVLVDATLVRGVLLPAALALCGDRAWGRRPAGPQWTSTTPMLATGAPNTAPEREENR
ncbi:MMPL family transporter [Micromonospora siamensis]|uniref:Putative drug exporter of the RND superfamily n=1 Tax=Micromonospora siamensis TaxID=299152 RepID=A0A1C5I4V4_9ACTN|nr:MMPL family transporter [Micromonospora siamensis]SCG53207.1 putative drug exporter of the RND superfamily [Micromonospora siamensis]